MRSTGKRGAERRAVSLTSIALIALAFAAVRMGTRPEPFVPPPGGPRVVHEDGYVGSGACISCHPDQHATWHASYHRTMTQHATPESVRAPFDGSELQLEGVTWRVERRGDEFWVEGRDGTRRLEKRIVMVTGSHNYQLYWMQGVGNQLQQFPLVYLLYDRIWIPRKERFLRPELERTSSEAGRWRSHCIKCHATRGRKAPPPDGEASVAELGIACEACHGPGEKHVTRNRAPFRRYGLHLSGEPDPTIVNPARLSHERATDVCGQCHSIEIFLDREKAEDWTRAGTRYRPGAELSRFQTTVVGRYRDNPPAVRAYLDRHPVFRLRNTFWPDGMLRVAGREYHGTLESPCYQRGQMSCLSCHAMHRPAGDARSLEEWAEDQLGPEMAGDRACLQCHEEYESAERLTAHSHHASSSAGSRCYNCHMPYTTWGLLRGIRSHTVSSPDVATSVATGRPDACNQCHLDRTLQWTAQTLEGWYGIEPPPLSEVERTTAASLLWALRGDAAQRALMAWSMGWEPAREVASTEWMVPYLSVLLLDPYPAVRFNTQRTLRSYPAYADVAANSGVGATKDEQAAMMAEILDRWNRTFTGIPGERARELLFLGAHMDKARMAGLVSQRDDRELILFE